MHLWLTNLINYRVQIFYKKLKFSKNKIAKVNKIFIVRHKNHNKINYINFKAYNKISQILKIKNII